MVPTEATLVLDRNKINNLIQYICEIGNTYT